MNGLFHILNTTKAKIQPLNSINALQGHGPVIVQALTRSLG